jgi:hypothetical protein
MSLPQAFFRYSPLGKQYFSRVEEPVTMMHMVAHRFIFLGLASMVKMVLTSLYSRRRIYK